MTDHQMQLLLEAFANQASLTGDIVELLRAKASLDDIRWQAMQIEFRKQEMLLRALAGLGQEARKASIV